MSRLTSGGCKKFRVYESMIEGILPFNSTYVGEIKRLARLTGRCSGVFITDGLLIERDQRTCEN